MRIGYALNRVAVALTWSLYLLSEYLICSLFTSIFPGEFGNARSKSAEIFFRILRVFFSLSLFPFALILWAFGVLIDWLGDLISQKKYTELKGDSEVKETNLPTLMTFNVCMLPGALPVLFGGVRPARERLDELASFILEKDPDILFLQEMSFESALSLWGTIKGRYIKGFSRIDPMSWLTLDTGLFIATKVPLIKEPFFISLPTKGRIRRGAFCIETKDQVFFVTHLESGTSEKDSKMREKQIEKILIEMKKIRDKPVILLGDLNIHRKGEALDEYSTHLNPHFINFCEITGEDTSTCTNHFSASVRGKTIVKESSEHIDYALVFKSPVSLSLEVSQIPTYDIKKGQALSDHKALFIRLLVE